MANMRIQRALVFDVTTAQFLRRVADNPAREEYALSDEGVFTFSPEIAGPGSEAHQIQITYDEVGPQVTLFDKRMTR